MPRLRCFMNGIFDSLTWGFIASSPLLIGCLIALYVNSSRQVITTIMAFGSGVLIATLTFSNFSRGFSGHPHSPRYCNWFHSRRNIF